MYITETKAKTVDYIEMNCKFYFIFLLALCTKWDKAHSFCSACVHLAMHVPDVYLWHEAMWRGYLS